MNKKSLLTLAALASLILATQAGGLRYESGAGWQATVPNILLRHIYSEKEHETSPGLRHVALYESRDKNLSLTIYTHPLDPNEEFETLHAFFEGEVTGRTKERAIINYTFTKDNWFVVSGTNALGYEFYTKPWRYEDHWVSFDFAYPSSQRKVYDPMLLELLRNFVPNVPGDWDY